jgi:hypothetical protein
MDQQPSVGRTVHYVAYGTPGGEFPAGECRAAIVTEVGTPLSGNVSLCVLNPSGLFFNRDVPYAKAEVVHGKPVPVAGTWHWPERT